MECNNNKNLDYLKKLTNELVDLSTIIQDSYNKVIELKVKDGSCTGFTLMTEKGCGVHRWFISGGSNFPSHKHKGIEIIIVYEGEIQLTIENIGLKILKRGQSAYIDENVLHSAIYPSDTWALSITIPPEEAYGK